MTTHHRLLAAALGYVAVATPADARPLKPEQEAQIKPAGDAVSCVNINQIRQTRVRDNSTIDFYMTGKRVYRNRLPHSCPSLGFEERFAYATSQSQLCSVDIITVLYSSPGLIQGASCGLGKFQPIMGAPK